MNMLSKGVQVLCVYESRLFKQFFDSSPHPPEKKGNFRTSAEELVGILHGDWSMCHPPVTFLSDGPGDACSPLGPAEAPPPDEGRCILGGERMWGAVPGDVEKRYRPVL